MVRITDASSDGVNEDAEARIASSLGAVWLRSSLSSFLALATKGLAVAKAERFGDLRCTGHSVHKQRPLTVLVLP